MTGFETCIRCGRDVPSNAEEFSAGEAIDDGGLICAGCVTPEELKTSIEDFEDLAQALEAAGLGGDSDPEAMSEDEYEMRKDLAMGLYEHEQRHPL